MIVLDTNVLSESLRPKPSSSVLEWMRSHARTALFTTAITEAEIHFGLALLPTGRRRNALEAAVALIFEAELSGRVLPFDSAAAREYAALAANRQRAGRPMSQADAQIAAIVRSRGATLATRNVADFDNCGFEVIDPWR
jgi:predicted nucleic acid-binding protein